MDPERTTEPSLSYHRGTTGLDRWSDGPAMVGLVAKALGMAVVSVALAISWLPARMFWGFLIGAALQGAVVGWGVRWALRSSGVRRRSIGVAVTLLAAGAAVGGLYVGLYLWNAVQMNLHYSGRVRGHLGLTFLFDRLLVRTVGHGGVFGYLLLALPKVRTIAFVHLVMTPWTAWAVAKRALSAARCPSCGQPLPPPRNAAVVPVEAAVPLVMAISAGDVPAVLEVVSGSAGVDLGSRCVVARGYRCVACGERSADVVAKTFGIRNRAAFAMMQVTAITEPFDDALRSEPAVAIDPPAGGLRMVE